MKRLIGSVVMAGMFSATFAQTSFTIVRPADGSKVREKVRILLPKKSVPDVGSYIGVFLDGKFLEARGPQSLVPDSKQFKEKYLEYDLDTKALGLKDNEPGKPSKLELVLYVDFNEKPRIVDRSSIDIFVGNKASIPVPDKGFLLRYGFQKGTESIYKVDRTVAISAISKGQNALGGRANEQEVSQQDMRMLYAVDNHYDNGDGLVRMQVLPDKGKDYTLVSVKGQPMKFDDTQLESWYMRQTNTGMETWSSIPMYFGIDGTNGQQNTTALIEINPFPSLPAKPVKVGDFWQTRFLQGYLPTDKDWFTLEKVTEGLPARGELTSVEWENGHPCAVIKNSIRFGDSTSAGQKLKKAGAKFTDNKIELDETVWFALDSKKVLRVQRTESIDIRADQIAELRIPGLDSASGPDNQVAGGQNGGGSAPGGMGTPGGKGGVPGPMGAGSAGGGRKGGGGPTGASSGFTFPQTWKQGLGGKQGRPPAGFTPPGPPPGFGVPGGQGRPPAGVPSFGQQGNGRFGQQTQTSNELAFVRVKITQTMTLEN